VKLLADKSVVVTGAGSGVGRASAELFAHHGARVVCADLRTEWVEETVGRIDAASGTAVAVTCDVGRAGDVDAAVQAAVDAYGRLDVMFNNAGIVGVIGSIADTSTDQWDRTVAVLMRGVFLGMKHAARVMVPQGSGSIISTSSTAGLMGGLGPHCYTACKHAVRGMTTSVASELGPLGIRVNAISPGNTVTAMTAAVITPGDHTAVDVAAQHIAAGSLLGIPGLPDDIAYAALYLASDEARNVTGHLLVVDAGQTTIVGNGRFHQQPTAVHHEAGRRT